jgi:L-ascorbate metabolism protein UlaG (beta-lactamase superfamily)
VSTNHLVYLRQNVICEPLVNRWYAWSYIIPPATSAMYIANHHLKVMQSFVQNPHLHAEMLKKPDMIGSPFINHDASKAGEVRALLDRTRKEQADLIEFAGAFKALGEMLGAEATGASLEPLYPKVPPPLRGYVELVYDLDHRARFRVIESLLYASRYYKPANQQIALSARGGDDRSFALSTPRLDSSDGLILDVPFASVALDELSRARHTPRPLGFMAECLRVTSSETLRPFFTDEAPPPPRPRYTDPGVRVRYFGHASILVESRRASVMFDPVIPYKHGAGVPRFGFDDLPETIDYVVITHNHQDHVLLETLLQLRHRVKHVVVPSNNPGSLADPSLKLLLRTLGFRDVVSLADLEKVEFDGGSITALPFMGEHGDLDVYTKAVHMLSIEGHTLLLAADSNNIEPALYAHVHDMVGDVDLLFIGMECDGAPMSWLYGPLFSKPLLRKNDQTRRFDGSDCAKALKLVEQFSPRQVYVYAMGAEPWLTFVTSIHYTDESRPIVESNSLVEACRQRGLRSERLFGCKDIVLEPRASP